jgi:hypothetical protein
MGGKKEVRKGKRERETGREGNKKSYHVIPVLETLKWLSFHLEAKVLTTAYVALHDLTLFVISVTSFSTPPPPFLCPSHSGFMLLLVFSRQAPTSGALKTCSLCLANRYSYD